jgi:hypothetical protein
MVGFIFALSGLNDYPVLFHFMLFLTADSFYLWVGENRKNSLERVLGKRMQ